MPRAENPMRRAISLLIVTSLLVLGISVPATANGELTASGTFDTTLDFSTLTVTPGGKACRLSVEGQLSFDGTLDGTADAATTALVFAPCSEVQPTPPGTFADVFRSRLEFRGTVAGTPATAKILSVGVTRAGGEIDAVMLVDGDDVMGRLHLDATVGVGGSYQGMLELD
jgi:hypothetical protein